MKNQKQKKQLLQKKLENLLKKESTKSTQNTSKIILIIVAVVLVSLIAVPATIILMIDDVKIYEIGINVDNIAGFNISSSEHFLQFGTSKPGSIVKRELILNNTEANSKKVIIKSYGEMNEWITLSENNFILDKHENKTIKIYVKIPEKAEYGKYSGKMKLYFIRIF